MARGTRLLLVLSLGVAACLAHAQHDSIESTQLQTGNSDTTTVTECERGQEKQCEGLARCSPPSVRLAVPESSVLVLGNSGCGKSTLARHLSGDYGDMQAVSEHHEFLITGDKIGSSVTSVTQIPEVMTDNKTGTNFFDCPGFDDNRGSCVEVSTTFYMKDILRHTKRVKVLLLTPYFAVSRGQDRSDFISMLLHAAHVLRNVSKLSHSVALIVTKMKPKLVRRGKQWVELPDDAVKESIAAFLREDALPYLALRAKESLPEEAADFQRSVELLNVFLAQNEQGNYTRIGIFRSPDEEGRLKDIALMEEGRQVLLNLVHNNIRYAEVVAADFGFSVSDRTKLFALQQSRNLSDTVVAEMAELGRSLAAARAEVAYDGDDITASALNFARASEQVRAVAADVSSSSSVQDFCDRLAAAVPKAAGGDAAALSLAARVAAECRHLDVLQTVSEAPLVQTSALASQWSQPLQQAADGLTARADWNRFLVSLYDRQNMLDQQVKRAAGQLTFPPVAAGGLPALESRVAALGLHASLRPEAANTDDLKALLGRMAAGPQSECLPGELLVVRGESLLLSEVADRVLAGCPGGVPVGWVQVYSLNTFFVDRAVRMPGVSLSVVAPRWEVVGDPLIDLSGSPGDGPARKPKEAAPGWRGSDGEAGRPGRPGGHFLGVGLDFAAGGRLRVTVRGGTGGAGQAGGDGGPGRSGGGNGADGGHGGVGGIGGRSGSVRLVALGHRPSTEFVSGEGRRGNVGRGGMGGDSRAFAGRYRRKRFVGILLGGLAIAGAVGGAIYVAKKASEPSRPPPPPPPPVYHNGAAGWDGQSSHGLQSPAYPRAARWEEVPARTAAYLELNLRHPYRSKQLQDFKAKLEREVGFTR